MLQLTPREAIPLCHVLVHGAASAIGSRALFLKGLSLDHHGLRPPRTPADVDVLLPPSDVDRFIAEMGRAGWRPRLGEFNDFPFPHHSVTLIHDRWPCDIDVHRSFPGFLANAADVFDVLWEARASMRVAGHEVDIAGFGSSVLVMALHSARSTPDNPRHANELHHLYEIAPSWTLTQKAGIADLATRTGAAKALEDVLPRMGIDAEVDASVINDPALRAWTLRVEGRAPAAITWFRHIAAGSPKQWASRIRDAVWPREEVFRAGRAVPPGRRALNEARARRLGRGLWTLPGALLAALGIRGRNVIDDADSRRRQN